MAKSADMKQRLDQLAENDTNIVTLGRTSSATTPLPGAT
jgi:hypothetical protein